MAEDQWYYARAGQQFGPVLSSALQQMAMTGQLSAQDMIWQNGLAAWIPAGTVPNLFPATPNMPVYQLEVAGFWLRFAAMILDLILMVVWVVIITVAAGLVISATAIDINGRDYNAVVAVIYILYFIGSWLYYALLESGPKQSTLGQRAIGIKVTDLEGRKISFGRATGRFFGKMISQIIFFIGYIFAGFTDKKQTLHDLIAGTLVVRS